MKQKGTCDSFFYYHQLAMKGLPTDRFRLYTISKSSSHLYCCVRLYEQYSLTLVLVGFNVVISIFTAQWTHVIMMHHGMQQSFILDLGGRYRYLYNSSTRLSIYSIACNES